MGEANLLTENAAAGDKFAIYETLRTGGGGEYKQAYLTSEYLASKPDPDKRAAPAFTLKEPSAREGLLFG